MHKNAFTPRSKVWNFGFCKIWKIYLYAGFINCSKMNQLNEVQNFFDQSGRNNRIEEVCMVIYLYVTFEG